MKQNLVIKYKLRKNDEMNKSILVLEFNYGKETAEVLTGYQVKKGEWNVNRSCFIDRSDIPQGVYFIQDIVEYLCAYHNLKNQPAPLKKICLLVKAICQANMLYHAAIDLPNLEQDPEHISWSPTFEDLLIYTKPSRKPFTYQFKFGRKNKKIPGYYFNSGEWDTRKHTLDLELYHNGKRTYVQLYNNLGIDDWDIQKDRFHNKGTYSNRNRLIFELVIFLDDLQNMYSRNDESVIKPDLIYIKKKIGELVDFVQDRNNSFAFPAEELYEKINDSIRSYWKKNEGQPKISEN